MHWKYHLGAGDAVYVETKDASGWGTVCGWVLDQCPPEGCSLDEYGVEDFTIRVQSGSEWRKNVTLDQVTDYVSEEDRETDLPLLSEEMRLSGGV